MSNKPLEFSIEKKLEGKLGRAGTLTTKNGVVKTPAFVVVGTKSTVKGLTPEMISDLGAQVVLANTYHLYLQPGEKVVEEAGGFPKFMNWKGPSMTDSGGFQVFSLGVAYGNKISKFSKKGDEELLLNEAEQGEEEKAKLVTIDNDGVMFRSHIDGSAHYFTPEKSIDIQHKLGADMFFAFDECTAPTESLHYQAEALDRTHRWAKKCLSYHKESIHKDKQAIFGVIQGGRFEDLRKESAQFFSELDFDGYGIGGSFAKEDMTEAVKWVNEILPEHKPRHLLGIGEPEDILMGIQNGCDLFDCVAPTRMGRNGALHTKLGRININNSEFINDHTPIDQDCGCYTCKNFTKSYLSHLFRAKEMLAGTLSSIHNLYFIVKLTDDARKAVIAGNFEDYKNEILKSYYKR
jgi:queuine tRNA-ribosyltransferase